MVEKKDLAEKQESGLELGDEELLMSHRAQSVQAYDRFGMPIDDKNHDNAMGFGVKMGEGIFSSKTPISER